MQTQLLVKIITLTKEANSFLPSSFAHRAISANGTITFVFFSLCIIISAAVLSCIVLSLT